MWERKVSVNLLLLQILMFMWIWYIFWVFLYLCYVTVLIFIILFLLGWGWRCYIGCIIILKPHVKTQLMPSHTSLFNVVHITFAIQTNNTASLATSCWLKIKESESLLACQKQNQEKARNTKSPDGLGQAWGDFSIGSKQMEKNSPANHYLSAPSIKAAGV